MMGLEFTKMKTKKKKEEKTINSSIILEGLKYFRH